MHKLIKHKENYTNYLRKIASQHRVSGRRALKIIWKSEIRGGIYEADIAGSPNFHPDGQKLTSIEKLISY